MAADEVVSLTMSFCDVEAMEGRAFTTLGAHGAVPP
jgi:hypothetical protein